jgi:histidinol-phosphate aminotransferase
MVVGALGRKGVIVRPLGGRLPTHIRVSIGTPPENERFIQALEAVLQSECHLRSY